MPVTTATNPQTGERVVLVDGAWMPLDSTATGPNGSKAFLAGGRWITDDTPPPPQPGLLDRVRNAFSDDNLDASGRPKYGQVTLGTSEAKPQDRATAPSASYSSLQPYGDGSPLSEAGRFGAQLVAAPVTTTAQGLGSAFGLGAALMSGAPAAPLLEQGSHLFDPLIPQPPPSRLMDVGMEKIGQAGERVGSAVLDRTGSPLLAAGANAATQVLAPAALTAGALKTAPALALGLADRLTGERGPPAAPPPSAGPTITAPSLLRRDLPPPDLTPDELTAAAESVNLLRRRVPVADVAALVEHAERNPEFAQQLADSHDTDAALGRTARTYLPPDQAAQPPREQADPNGQRSAGPPAPDAAAGQPGEPGSTAGPLERLETPITPVPPPRARAERPWLDVGHDVPLAGGKGMQVDPGTGRRLTYIDRGIPEWVWEPKSGKWVNAWSEIDEHEAGEEPNLDLHGYGHAGDAHDQFGNPATRSYLTQQGVKFDDYQTALKPYIDAATARAEDGRATNIPADLDQRPYHDFRELLKGHQPTRESWASSQIWDKDGGSYTAPQYDAIAGKNGDIRLATAQGPDGFATIDLRSGSVLGRGNTAKVARARAQDYVRDNGLRSMRRLPELSQADLRAEHGLGKVPAGNLTPMVHPLLDDPGHRRMLVGVGERAGWPNGKPGTALRADRYSDPVGRASTLGADPMFAEAQRAYPLPQNVNGLATREAIRKALTNEPMRSAEKQHVGVLLDALDTERREARRADEATLDRARSIDPDGFESAAVRFENDDAGMRQWAEDRLRGQSGDMDRGRAASQALVGPAPWDDGALDFSRFDAPSSVEDLADALSRKFGRPVRVESVAPPSEQSRAMATAVRRLFGRKVEFIRSDDRGMRGVYMGGKSLFVNADTARPHAEVIGHELLHSLRAESPETYNRLVSALEPVLRDSEARAFKQARQAIHDAHGLGRLPDSKLHEELIADIVGDHFADPAFIRELQKSLEPDLFRRIAAHILDFLDRARSKLSGSRKDMGRQAARFVEDIEAARAAVRQALAEIGSNERARSASGLKGLQLPNRIPAKASGPSQILREFDRAPRPTETPSFSRDNRFQTDTPEFKRWFGGSKVVGDNGEPKVVYHSTRGNFDVFENKPGNDAGFHFGSSEQAVGRLNNTRGKLHVPGQVEATEQGENILPVYLSIKNPLRVKDPGLFGASDDDFRAQLQSAGIPVAPDDSFKQLREKLEKAGYDGLVYSNIAPEEGAGDSWAALRSEQIKSAIGNRGTFDPTDPRIDFAREDEIPVTRVEPFDVIAEDLFHTANEWYRQHLQGTEVTAPDGTPVKFSKLGRSESLFTGRRNLQRMSAVQALRDLAQHAPVMESIPDRANRPGVSYVYAGAPLEIGGKTYGVRLIYQVGQDQGRRFYDFRGYEMANPGAIDRGHAPEGALGAQSSPGSGFTVSELREAFKNEPSFSRGDDGGEPEKISKTLEGQRALMEVQSPKLSAGMSIDNKPLMRAVGRGSIRHAFAVLTRVSTSTERALRRTRAMFDQMLATPGGRRDIRAAVEEWERGQVVSNQRLRPFFESMKEAFDQRIKAVLATGLQVGYWENYFPHLFKERGAAEDWLKNYLARRTLEGGKGWTKDRYYKTLEAAREAGLEPLSENPADMMQAHLRQMDRYIAMHQIVTDLQKRGLVIEDPGRYRTPTGYARVADPAFHGRLVPTVIAKDLNATLGPSLYDQWWWRSFRKAQNAMVSAELGFSAFHGALTTLDTIAAHLGDTIQRAAIGDVGGALTSAAKAVVSPVLSPYAGTKLIKQSLGESASNAQTAALLRILEEGGHQVYMSPTELNDSYVKMRREMRQGKWLQAGKEAPFVLLENITPLLHKHLVPAQKMTAKVLALKFELDRLAGRLTDESGKPIQRGDYAAMEKAMSEDAIRQVAGRVVQQVDERLGQMNYRNLFWNRSLRDAFQAMFASFGWQIGALKTIGGGWFDTHHLVAPPKILGPLDKAGAVQDASFGRLSGRTAYMVGLHALIIGLCTGVTYALTGTGPQNFADLYTMRTGRKNTDGSDERIIAPSYIKDEIELRKHPMEMALNKINPALRVMGELVKNRDYYGNEIYNPDDSPVVQGKQIAEHLATAFVPFSASGLQKSLQAGKSGGMIAANMMGFNPAPAYMTRSPFESFLADRRALDATAKTPEGADESQAFFQALAALRRGENPDLSGFGPRQQRRLLQDAAQPPQEAAFKRLNLTDRLRAWDRATDAERVRFNLQRHLFSPGVRESLAELSPDQQAEAMQKLEQIENWQPAATVH